MQNDNSVSTKLSRNDELALYLIGTDLRTAKYYHVTTEAGMFEDYKQTMFGDIVLECLGFGKTMDRLLDYYYQLIKEHSRDLGPEDESVRWTAYTLYSELIKKRDASAARPGATPRSWSNFLNQFFY